MSKKTIKMTEDEFQEAILVKRIVEAETLERLETLEGDIAHTIENLYHKLEEMKKLQKLLKTEMNFSIRAPWIRKPSKLKKGKHE